MEQEHSRILLIEDNPGDVRLVRELGLSAVESLDQLREAILGLGFAIADRFAIVLLSPAALGERGGKARDRDDSNC